MTPRHRGTPEEPEPRSHRRRADDGGRRDPVRRDQGQQDQGRQDQSRRDQPRRDRGRADQDRASELVLAYQSSDSSNGSDRYQAAPRSSRSASRRSVSPTIADRRGSSRTWVLSLSAIAGVVAVGLFLAGVFEPTPTVVVAPTSDAKPYVRDFASQLEGKVEKPLPSPQLYSHGANVDGCDHAYGARGECVPVNFPKGVANTPAAKCKWLKQQGFKALEVRGPDGQNLVPAGGKKAPSGNPYACPNELG